jgi:hypothetical protein
MDSLSAADGRGNREAPLIPQSTNDQAPMTNQTAMTNVPWRVAGWALLFRLRFRFIPHAGAAHELGYGDESIPIHIKSFEDKVCR